MNDNFDKFVTFFRRYLKEPPKPYEIYGGIVETYNALNKKLFHVKEIELYHENLYTGNLSRILKFFNYKGLKKIKKNMRFDYVSGYPAIISDSENKAIVLLPHLILGKSYEVDEFLKKISTIDQSIHDAVQRKYGRIAETDWIQREEVIFTDEEYRDRDEVTESIFDGQWKEETVELENNEIKAHKMKIFVKDGYKSKAIIMSREEIEKVYLRAFLKEKASEMKIFDKKPNLSEILEPYDVVTNFYMRSRDFAVTRHSLKSTRLSPKFLKFMLNNKGMGVKNVFLFEPVEADNVEVYEIDNQYITIAPRFMIKTPQDPTDIINKAGKELSEAVNGVHKINVSIETVHYGNFYRLDRNVEKRKEKPQIIEKEVGTGIKIEIENKNTVARVRGTLVGKYYAKKIYQEMKK